MEELDLDNVNWMDKNVDIKKLVRVCIHKITDLNCSQTDAEKIKLSKAEKYKIAEIYMYDQDMQDARHANTFHRPFYVDKVDEDDVKINGEPADMTEEEIQKQEKLYKFFNWIYDILHDEMTDHIAMFIYIVIVLSILISVCATMISTLPALQDKEYWDTIELAVTMCFSAEYIAKVLIVRNKMRYVALPMNVLDLLAILPFYVGIMFNGADAGGVGGVLRALRLTRIAKIKQLASPYTHILTQSMINSVKGTGSAVAIFLFIGCVMTGTLAYAAEKDHNAAFESIPASMWWSIVTMTTVGYGDLYPTTTAGRFIGAFTIMMGMSLTSLIIMVIGQYYIDLLSEYEEELAV
eukprot:UN34537